MRRPDSDCSATERLVRLSELIGLTGLPRSTLYYRIRRGKFPKPYKAGRVSLWRWSEVSPFFSTPNRYVPF